MATPSLFAFMAALVVQRLHGEPCAHCIAPAKQGIVHGLTHLAIRTVLNEMKVIGNAMTSQAKAIRPTVSCS